MQTSNWENVKSLFHHAVELSSDERTDYLSRVCNGDEQLRRDVERLLSAHDRAGDFIVDPVLVEAGLVAPIAEDLLPEQGSALSVTRVGQYEIIRELGRGGMGAVFLAERADAQFEKQVAIKIVKRGMDTESILRRFLMERQILANLEHPNIARFLDGGVTDDGLPYFVMEYVEGEPLTKYSDARGLNTVDRLKLFQQVCAAVKYAHQNLIVHRDLKPSNILVASDGTPKLLDFGIAKLVSATRAGDDADQTATAMRLMTPEYASPEQLRGLPITTASDVYSLGVVLYELLTGHRPFHFHSNWPDEMVRVLLTEQPLKPSEAATRRQPATTAKRNGNAPSDQTNLHPTIRNTKSLRGDLDNIVLKALHKERERRYPSVQEFSEDIRRHLVGLPVSARPDSFGYRVGKFVQRHRTSVTLTTIFVATLFSATVVTSWQAHVARRERSKAEQRFSEQRKLANSLITEVQTSLKNVPHSMLTQRLLAEKSLEYLNNMAKDAGDNPEFLGELAVAYRNLGYLQSWTLQNNPGAVRCYETAIDLCRRRLVIQRDSLPVKRALAETLWNKVESLNLMQRLEEASETCNEKLGIEEEFLNAAPQDPDQLMSTAQTYEEYGVMLRALKQIAEATSKFQSALVLATRAVDLLKAQATTPQQRADLALMQQKQGSIYEQLNEPQQAANSYSEAAATASAVHVEHPELVQALRNTTSSYWYLGMVMDRLGDHWGALQNFRVSLKTIMDATAIDPTVDPTRYGEEKYSVVVGKALCKVGNKEEGTSLIRHGADIALNYARLDKGGNAQNSIYGVEVLTWAVEGLSLARLTDEARRLCLEAIKLVEQSAQDTDDPNPKLHLVLLYELMGNVEAGYDTEAKKITTNNRARLIEARQWYQKARDLLVETVQKFNVSAVASEDQINTLNENVVSCDALLGP